MLKAVCVVSANDCAVALAEHLAGSEEAFVERMNQRAAELGMEDTTFKNACGLPAEGHVTSAYDIALMSRELMLHHPDIRNYTTIWMDTLRGGTSSLVNTNKLVRFYDGTTGLKTGSTNAAGYCISATAERDGMELIAVILKGKTSAERFPGCPIPAELRLRRLRPANRRPGNAPAAGTGAAGDPGHRPTGAGRRRKAAGGKGQGRNAGAVRDAGILRTGPVAVGGSAGDADRHLRGKRFWRNCPCWRGRRFPGSPSAKCCHGAANRLSG